MKLSLIFRILFLVLLTTFVSARPPPPQPLKKLIESCESIGVDCNQIAYYASKNKISKTRIKYYLERGCTFLQMDSCYSLGEFLIKNGHKKDAWLPMAKACFSNHNVACNTLRTNKMLIPLFMSRKPNWGPNWHNDFSNIDNPIISNQRAFSGCYKKRQLSQGELYLKIFIKEGKVVDVNILKNSLSEGFSNCLVKSIKSIYFGRGINIDIIRYFEYAKIYTEGRL